MCVHAHNIYYLSLQNILYAWNTDRTIPAEFRWTENDLRQLSMADYIVATDGIYIVMTFT